LWYNILKVKEEAAMAKPSVNQEFVNKVLRECKLESSAVNRLHQEYKKTVKEAGAAGWHGFDDIQTLIGLEGTYLWSEDPFKLAHISFKFDAGNEGSQGTYKITSNTVEQDSFVSVPNNPLIGWAFINLLSNNKPSRVFTVAGMMTDDQWRIIILLLNKIGPEGPILPPFSAIRTS
jgi:hypothetical protein